MEKKEGEKQKCKEQKKPIEIVMSWNREIALPENQSK